MADYADGQPTGELTLRTLAMPSDANAAGDIFGGWVMAQMDLACGIRAAERAKGRVVTAAVKDVEAWLKFKPELVAQMSAVGSDGTSYVAMDGSNRVASTWDVPDIEAFQAAQTAASPEMAEAMERYGMIPPATVYIEK